MEIDVEKIGKTHKPEMDYISTKNACKLCSPLGASVVFKGIRNCLPLIHGSQGCATYIRRYLISHYKEPIDIASSNFSEETTIFGGNKNFNTGIDNIIKQYSPEAIGIATTCLSETIGEDVHRLITEYKIVHNDIKLPAFFNVATPSYQGTHIDGFHETVLAVVSNLATLAVPKNHINIYPGFISPEDIRHLKEILADFGIKFILFPDYSETLDNPSWDEYHKLSPGGTSVEELCEMSSAKTSIELGLVFNKGITSGRVRGSKSVSTAGEFLDKNFGVNCIQTIHPIGISATDEFFKVLEKISNKQTSEKFTKERGRLVDAYIDGHKYVFGKKAIVYGDEDFVISLSSFLDEIGISVVLAATGGESGIFAEAIKKYAPNSAETMIIGAGWDFDKIAEMAKILEPDIMVGNSKGYYISRDLGIPLLRVGFPIHDRIGGQRMLHLGYKGTQQLFDSIVNLLIEAKQNNSPVGYKYM